MAGFLNLEGSHFAFLEKSSEYPAICIFDIRRILNFTLKPIGDGYLTKFIREKGLLFHTKCINQCTIRQEQNRSYWQGWPKAGGM